MRLIDADLFFEEIRKTKPDKWVDYGSVGYSKELIKEVLDKTPTVDVVDNIISDILSVTTWLDGACLVVSRDEVIDIMSRYK